ncbi:ABC transporter permease [Micromonospora polyrhachis]|uniref:Putative ABC transport system permease protein n=1 Tax=Micromonospora polyrhachis TaxID=1282883 RepID=A0A7W7SQY9_9ACTN|nr:ABC transporter permease [Micromonospora polyrhachis]MBB4959335.1 putative ABC transport system permease protein [Micromonospora polyrhachis]
MLMLTLATLRIRWRSFVGMFVALALGAALVAALGQVLATTISAPDREPQRYQDVTVVVVGVDELNVPTWRGTETEPLAQRRGVPATTAARLPDAVADRVFPATLAEGPGGSVGRPWSARTAAGQTLLAGRAPATDDEIVVSAGARPGDQVQVITTAGVRPYTVVGLNSPTREICLFFTDARAAELSPRIDALLTRQPEAQVRAAVGTDARVLVGDARARLDPNREGDADARNNANTIAGIALGFAIFISIAVVAATFAFAVGQRRREMALLRAAGATPGQIRRMIYTEALVVSSLAAAAGAVAGPYAAPALLDWLIARRMAPDWIDTVSNSAVPAYLAFGTGVLVALLAVVIAAWQASRIRPGEALRQATVQTRHMPLSRWVLGLGTLATALVSMAFTAIDDPGSATNRKTYMPVLMLLIAAAALLAPAVVRPTARLLTLPFQRSGGAIGMLVAATVTSSARRTATLATPVLMTVALPAMLLTASTMTDTAKAAAGGRSVQADYLVLPNGTAGLDNELTARLRAVPGADVSTISESSVYTLDGDTALNRRPAEGTELVPDDAIVVEQDWGYRVGDNVRLWLADGTETRLRVIGLLPLGATTAAQVSPRNARADLPSKALVDVRPGSDPTAVEAALRHAARGHRAAVVSKPQWSAATAAAQGDASRLGLLMVLGILLTYTTIALVNTLVMGAPDRAGERRVMSLLGADRGQVLRYALAESLVSVAVGVVLAAAVTVAGLGGLWLALLRVAGPIALDVSWGALGAVVGGCVLIATILPALLERASHSSVTSDSVPAA